MQRNLFIIAALLLSSACGGAIDAQDQAQDDVTNVPAALFTVQRDERKCAAPKCGGFWASAMNQDASPSYVADLDLSKAGLDRATQSMIRAAPAEELLFRARLGNPDKSGRRKLVIVDAYRGMPGIVPAAKDVLFSVAQKAPQINCVTAPCNNETATDVSSGKSTDLTRVAVERAAQAFVDQEWLTSRVLLHGALVAAHVASGKKMAGGAETVLDASQVWLHLPESAGPCQKPRQQSCGAGQVQAYDRTADRCVESVGCVDQGVCPMMQPVCPAGYVASSWAAAPNGCAQTACDPAWVVQ